MASPIMADAPPEAALGDNPVEAYEQNTSRALGDAPPAPDHFPAADGPVPLTRTPTYSFDPPTIPSTWGESFHSWLRSKPARDSAAAELHMHHKHTPYFSHASLNNVPMHSGSESLAQLWTTLHSDTSDVSNSPPPVLHASMGTEVAADGKVAAIRLVDVDAVSDGGSTASSETCKHSFFRKSERHRRLVNTVEVGNPNIAPGTPEWDAEPKVIIVHGYGAGSAFFFQNVKALAQAPVPSPKGSGETGNRLFLLDWLGMGRSARVPFRPKPDLLNDDSDSHESGIGAQWPPGTPDRLTRRRVEAAEEFFLDSFEAWRRAMKIDRFILIGHSLGAYLSLSYTLRHPEQVDRLVLVSPAAMGIDPKTLEATAKGEKQASEEAGAEDPKLKPESPGVFGRAAISFFTYLWDHNFSPFALLRGSLFAGPKLVSKYTIRRFGHLEEEDLRCMHTYAHGIFVARGSITRSKSIKDVPISLIYGSNDWMDVGAGQQIAELLRKNGSPKASVYVVPKAGHNVFLDSPTPFNQLASALLRAPYHSGAASPFPSNLNPDGRIADDKEVLRLCAAWSQMKPFSS